MREGKERFGEGKAAEPVDPVIVYPLNDGGTCSVISGYVYRGAKIAWLRGQFLYGDFCAGWIKAAPVEELDQGAEVGRVEQLSSFGEGLRRRALRAQPGGSALSDRSRLTRSISSSTRVLSRAPRDQPA